MKKNLLIILTILTFLIVGLTGCNEDKSNQNQDDNNSSEPVDDNTDDQQDDEVKEDDEETEPNTIYVGGTGNNNFTSIQDAIEYARNNNTIYVYSGFYNEILHIEKSINILGQNKTNTIINSRTGRSPVRISKGGDFVNISGFTIQNATDEHVGFGLWISDGQYCRIIDNIFKNNYIGIEIINDNNYISENNFTLNINVAIIISGDNNTILKNEITHNYGRFLIITANSFNNTIYHNNIYNNLIDQPNWDIAYDYSNGDQYSNNWYSSELNQGNYWGLYTGSDSNGDGIGDSPFNITGKNVEDKYPWISMMKWFKFRLFFYIEA